MVYFARAFSSEINPGEGESTKNIRWFTKAEIETNSEIMDLFKSYALKALDILAK